MFIIIICIIITQLPAAGFVFGMRHAFEDKTVKLCNNMYGNMYGTYGTSVKEAFVLTPSGSQGKTSESRGLADARGAAPDTITIIITITMVIITIIIVIITCYYHYDDYYYYYYLCVDA